MANTVHALISRQPWLFSSLPIYFRHLTSEIHIVMDSRDTLEYEFRLPRSAKMDFHDSVWISSEVNLVLLKEREQKQTNPAPHKLCRGFMCDVISQSPGLKSVSVNLLYGTATWAWPLLGPRSEMRRRGGGVLLKDGGLFWNSNQHEITICPLSVREMKRREREIRKRVCTSVVFRVSIALHRPECIFWGLFLSMCSWLASSSEQTHTRTHTHTHTHTSAGYHGSL